MGEEAMCIFFFLSVVDATSKGPHCEMTLESDCRRHRRRHCLVFTVRYYLVFTVYIVHINHLTAFKLIIKISPITHLI